MNKNILWVIVLLIVTSLSFTACSENDDSVDIYANWDARNQNFIDSIASEAKAKPNEWKVILSYKLNPDLGTTFSNNDYVYCKIIRSATNIDIPNFTDIVSVNYRGSLINGEVFDQNYTGVYDFLLCNPVDLKLDEVVTGFSTALQGMSVGDRWQVYIPSELAYGLNSSGKIPAYSTLIFDIDLVGIIPFKGLSRGLDIEKK